ncbi:unnamed protein product, partial [Closterium sp. NIES-54]
CGIVEHLLSLAAHKQTKDLKRSDGSKRQRVSGIVKLDDANEAGGRNAEQCTLILTEGDSAKTLAVSGLSVVGRDRYGVFPLRGKLLNVRDASHRQMMENTEIGHLKQILGLQHGKSYESVKALRYGHLMIMTDQVRGGGGCMDGGKRGLVPRDHNWHRQMMENTEIGHLKQILGLQHGAAADPGAVRA